MRSYSRFLSPLKPIHFFFAFILMLLTSCNNKPKEKAEIKEEVKPTSLNVIKTYNEATKQLTSAEKIGQLFMPAAYINDTEEEIQKLEQLIKEQHVGALCFFKSRSSAAANYDGQNKSDLV